MFWPITRKPIGLVYYTEWPTTIHYLSFFLSKLSIYIPMGLVYYTKWPTTIYYLPIQTINKYISIFL